MLTRQRLRTPLGARHRAVRSGPPGIVVLAALATLLVVAVALVAGLGATGTTGGGGAAAPARPFARSVAGPDARPVARPVVPVGTASAQARPVSRPAAILRHWDRRRSRAWSSQDPDRLHSLYAAGSAAGREDVAMLRAWTRRGLRVPRLRMRLLSVDVVSRSSDRLELAVTDRLEGGWARAGSGQRVPLPHDTASSRTVVLLRHGQTWRVSAVRAREGQPAR